MTTADLLRMVRQLCYEHDVVGVDVVEVAPAYDHADSRSTPRTAWCSRRSRGMAARRRDAAPDATPGPPAR